MKIHHNVRPLGGGKPKRLGQARIGHAHLIWLGPLFIVRTTRKCGPL